MAPGPVSPPRGGLLALVCVPAAVLRGCHTSAALSRPHPARTHVAHVHAWLVRRDGCHSDLTAGRCAKRRRQASTETQHPSTARARMPRQKAVAHARSGRQGSWPPASPPARRRLGCRWVPAAAAQRARSDRHGQRYDRTTTALQATVPVHDAVTRQGAAYKQAGRCGRHGPQQRHVLGRFAVVACLNGHLVRGTVRRLQVPEAAVTRRSTRLARSGPMAASPPAPRWWRPRAGSRNCFKVGSMTVRPRRTTSP